jgi:hypothetical protein
MLREIDPAAKKAQETLSPSKDAIQKPPSSTPAAVSAPKKEMEAIKLSEQARKRIEEWRKHYNESFLKSYTALERNRGIATNMFAVIRLASNKTPFAEDLAQASTTEDFVACVKKYANDTSIDDGTFKTVILALQELAKDQDDQSALNAIYQIARRGTDIDVRISFLQFIFQTLTDSLQANLNHLQTTYSVQMDALKKAHTTALEAQKQEAEKKQQEFISQRQREKESADSLKAQVDELKRGAQAVATRHEQSLSGIRAELKTANNERIKATLQLKLMEETLTGMNTLKDDLAAAKEEHAEAQTRIAALEALNKELMERIQPIEAKAAAAQKLIPSSLGTYSVVAGRNGRNASVQQHNNQTLNAPHNNDPRKSRPAR